MLVLHVYSNVLTWMYSESVHVFTSLVSSISIPKKSKAQNVYMIEAYLNSRLSWIQTWVR